VEALEYAGEHVRTQTNQRHYQTKLEEQQAAVARAGEIERQVELEYLVRSRPDSHPFMDIK